MKKTIITVGCVLLLSAGAVPAVGGDYVPREPVEISKSFELVVPTPEIAEDVLPLDLELTHPVKQEDDPTWDCRVDGNRMCGVQLPGTGVWYIISFDENGNATGVSPRD